MNINSGKILKSANKYAMVFLECVFGKEGLHMTLKEKKELIIEMINRMDDNKMIESILYIVQKVFGRGI